MGIWNESWNAWIGFCRFFIVITIDHNALGWEYHVNIKCQGNVMGNVMARSSQMDLRSDLDGMSPMSPWYPHDILLGFCQLSFFGGIAINTDTHTHRHTHTHIYIYIYIIICKSTMSPWCPHDVPMMGFQGTASRTSSCASSAFSMASVAIPPWLPEARG